jgi:hypothetical protein
MTKQLKLKLLRPKFSDVQVDDFPQEESYVTCTIVGQFVYGASCRDKCIPDFGLKPQSGEGRRLGDVGISSCVI